MSYAQDVAAVVGSPVTFKFEGRDVTFKPLDWDAFGQLMSIFVMRRVAAVPSMSQVGELIESAVKSDNAVLVKSVVAQAMETLRVMNLHANDPSFDELLSWVMNDPIGIVEALKVCSGEDGNTLLRLVMTADKDDKGMVAKAMRRWMHVSGVKSDIDDGSSEGEAKN